MDENSPRPFFVYGTLLPEQPNYYVWGESVMAAAEAWLANGRLYDLGHYPMLIEEGKASVRGMVIFVERADYVDVLTRLDHLEGYDPAQPGACAYRRVARRVRLANGRSETAWVYVGQPQYVAEVAVVSGGDWAAYVTEMQKESLEWWRDVKSVSGLLD
jgi:gamma-glutamylcyclotransferase (GGCT)/AIG2-like uncharacterized protein YtfP